jgi:hypothetical protein
MINNYDLIEEYKFLKLLEDNFFIKKYYFSILYKIYCKFHINFKLNEKSYI